MAATNVTGARDRRVGASRLHRLEAAVSNENVASQRVLEKAGFVATGLTEVGGRKGMRYELALEQR